MPDHSSPKKEHTAGNHNHQEQQQRGGRALPAVHPYGRAPVQPKTEKHWLSKMQEGMQRRTLPAVPAFRPVPVQKMELDEEELPVQQKSIVRREGETDAPAPEPEEDVPGASIQRRSLAETEPTVQKKQNNTGLPDNLKEGIETLSGYAMDDVTVHYNSDKPAQLQALAYAQGTDIHIGPGQERHLPHEAWHVVQQKQGRVQPKMQMKGTVPVNDDKGLEREADEWGAKAFAQGHETAAARATGANPGRASAVGHPVIQRQMLSKISYYSEHGTVVIDDIVIGGRTPSPFSGTMGAHSTAWIAHIDAVRRTLVNIDLVKGLEFMIGLIDEELKSPLLKLKKFLETGHKEVLQGAEDRLKTSRDDANKHYGKISASDVQDDAGTATAKEHLNTLIGDYLTYVNYLPMSTVEGGDPGGHGESAARGDLNTFEYVYTNVRGAKMGLEEEIKALNKKSGLKKLTYTDEPDKQEVLKKELIESLWTLLAAETPDLFREDSKKEDKKLVWKTPLKNFLETIRSTYPHAYDFAAMYTPDAQQKGLDYAMDQAKQPKFKLNELLDKEEKVLDDTEATYLRQDIEGLSTKGLQGKIKAGGLEKFEYTKETEDKQEALKKELIESLWTLFAAETPDIFSADLEEQNKKLVWKTSLKNFLNTIRIAYPHAYDFAAMHTMEAQQKGLDYAMDQAEKTKFKGRDNAMDQAKKPKLKLNELLDKKEEVLDDGQAFFRDENNEVTASDLKQSGHGFLVTILVDNQGAIGDVSLVGAVEMIGRTESPFSGTMGAHTTAWVAHLDSVRNTLGGKNIGQAIASIQHKAKEAMNDESMNVIHELNEKHQIKLVSAYNALKASTGKAQEQKDKAVDVQVDFLENFIFEYLTFVNFLPMSTISIGGIPNGRSEGIHRSFLSNYEDFGSYGMGEELSDDFFQDEMTKHIKGLFDKNGLNHFPEGISEEEREEVDFELYTGQPFDKEHDLYKQIKEPDTKKKYDNKDYEKMATNRFYKTIIEAYPRSVADIGFKDELGQKAWSSAVETIKTEEKEKLEEILNMKNSIMNAIKQEKFGTGELVSGEELLSIRVRLGNPEIMIQATEKTISVICDVLKITDEVVVIPFKELKQEEEKDSTESLEEEKDSTESLKIIQNSAVEFIPYHDDMEETETEKTSTLGSPETKAKRKYESEEDDATKSEEDGNDTTKKQKAETYGE